LRGLNRVVDVVDRITEIEIREAMKKLKNGKTAG